MIIYDISRISSCSNQVFQETSIATGPVLCHPIDMLLVVEIPWPVEKIRWGYPQIIQVMDDHFSIETYWNPWWRLKILHFRKPPSMNQACGISVPSDFNQSPSYHFIRGQNSRLYVWKSKHSADHFSQLAPAPNIFSRKQNHLPQCGRCSHALRVVQVSKCLRCRRQSR